MRRDDMAQLSPSTSGICRVSAQHFPGLNQTSVADDCWVVDESALFIQVVDVGTYTMMWTRTDEVKAAGYLPLDGVLSEGPIPEAMALCAGFLLTECFIDSLGDIESMAICPEDPQVVKVSLIDPTRNRSRRRGGIVVSSCGLCGGVEEVGNVLSGLAAVADNFRMLPGDITSLMSTMVERQTVFRSTGGAHAAALFSKNRQLLFCAEDLGRHNALDKVIGQVLLQHSSCVGCGVLLSGRVSLELVIKAARAGIELIAAVSAPSSLAIDAAKHLGITLCGFVRHERLTVFTHPHRLEN